MPIIRVEESNYAGPIEDDTILRARCTSVKFASQPFKNDDGTDVIKCEFWFQVEDPTSPYDGQRISGKTSTLFNTHPDCKLHSWAQELLATELAAGHELDTDNLVDCQARIIVGQRKYTNRDGEDKVANFVKDLIRVGASSYASAEPF